MARDIEEWLGKRVRDDGIGFHFCGNDGYALRERFDESHSERPDVAGWRKARGCGFRRAVRAGARDRRARLSNRSKSIAGKLQLVGRGEDVGRLDAAMNQALAVGGD